MSTVGESLPPSRNVSAQGGQKLSAGANTLTHTSRMIFSATGAATLTITYSDGSSIANVPITAGNHPIEATAINATLNSDFVIAYW